MAGSGIRDVDRGLAAEFASHPGLDYPALKTHLIIDIIALNPYMGRTPTYARGRRTDDGAKGRSREASPIALERQKHGDARSRISPPNCAAATAGSTARRTSSTARRRCTTTMRPASSPARRVRGPDPTGSRHAPRPLPLRGPLPLRLTGGEGLLQPCAHGGGSGGGEEMILHLVARRLGAVVFA